MFPACHPAQVCIDFVRDMAFARLPALVEAAARADQEKGGEEEGEEKEVYVLLDFSSAELPPGVELRGNLAIDVRCPAHRLALPRNLAPPHVRPTHNLFSHRVSTRRHPLSNWASTCFVAPMKKTLAAR